jgi:hypothetical protein
MVLDCSFESNAANASGGGMFIEKLSSPAVTGCVFADNFAGGEGGGVANRHGSDPWLTSCVFTGNTAGADGGGMANRRGSNPRLTNCVFGGNSAVGAGGAILNTRESSPLVTNCTLVDNDAGGAGGAMACFFESSPVVTNCVLWANSSGAGSGAGAQIHAQGESAPLVTYSCLQGGGAGTGLVDADPQFADRLGPDGLPGTGDEDLHLGAGSPCIDAGDNTALPPDVDTDLDGNPRFVDAVNRPDVGNPDGVNPIVDMGAYDAPEGQPAAPALAYILWRHRVSGENALWMMNGTEVLPGSGPLSTVPSAYWKVAGVGDFDGDGNAYDVLWRHTLLGNNFLWFLDGRSQRSDSGPIDDLDDTDWMVAATGDFDGDGKSDIFWRHRVSGKNSLWLMDGLSKLPGSGSLPEVGDLNWGIAGTGDFNGDGRSDVLWRNQATGRNTVWLLNGTSLQRGSGSIPQVTNPSWQVAGTPDFDGDGKSDILWHHSGNGGNSLWLMDGTTRRQESGPIQPQADSGWFVAATAD